MTSKADIKALIDEAETAYRECWATLCELRGPDNPEDPESGDLFRAMLDFQPTLARALFDLSEMYRRLHKEKRSVVGRKARLSPEWFKRRLKTLHEYQRDIEIVVALGRRLGDSLAWIFFEGESKHLGDHFNQQSQSFIPPGVGGLGELKFLENHGTIDGHLVIYHGITTFLRIGDISLIDLRTGDLAAIGELKTTKVSDSELNITVSTVGPRKEGVLATSTIETRPDDMGGSNTVRELPQSMRARLDRQVAAMAESFREPRLHGHTNVESRGYVSELEALCKRARTSNFASSKVGDGHILFAMKVTKRSLAGKLLGGYRLRIEELDDHEKEIKRIIRTGSQSNELWVGPLFSPKPGYVLTPGMVPLFWWPLDVEVIEAILFHDVWVFSVYNPVHLVEKLRTAGFEVESLDGRRGFRVQKKLGDRVLTIEGFDYFTHLITGQLWNEEAVVDILSRAAQRAEDEAVPPPARVEMRIQQRFEPEAV